MEHLMERFHHIRASKLAHELYPRFFFHKRILSALLLQSADSNCFHSGQFRNPVLP